MIAVSRKRESQNQGLKTKLKSDYLCLSILVLFLLWTRRSKTRKNTIGIPIANRVAKFLRKDVPCRQLNPIVIPKIGAIPKTNNRNIIGSAIIKSSKIIRFTNACPSLSACFDLYDCVALRFDPCACLL